MHGLHKCSSQGGWSVIARYRITFTLAQPDVWKRLLHLTGSIAGAMENESTRVSRPEAGISARFPHLARFSLSKISSPLFNCDLVGLFCFVVDH